MIVLRDRVPRTGDTIELLAEKWTEKAPSAGRVVAVAEDGTVAVRHSDTVEIFNHETWGEMYTASSWQSPQYGKPAHWMIS